MINRIYSIDYWVHNNNQYILFIIGYTTINWIYSIDYWIHNNNQLNIFYWLLNTQRDASQGHVHNYENLKWRLYNCNTFYWQENSVDSVDTSCLSVWTVLLSTVPRNTFRPSYRRHHHDKPLSNYTKQKPYVTLFQFRYTGTAWIHVLGDNAVR